MLALRLATLAASFVVLLSYVIRTLWSACACLRDSATQR